jgi:hypothetical protein
MAFMLFRESVFVRIRLNTVNTVYGGTHGSRDEKPPAVRVSESGMWLRDRGN